MNGKTGDAQSEAAHRAVAKPVADPGAHSSSAVRSKRWATAKELSALAGIVVAAVGVLLGGTQWAVSSALETTLTFAVSPLREDLRLVHADMRSFREDMRSVQADIRSFREDMRSVQADMRLVQADMRLVQADMRSVQADMRSFREDMRSVQADIRSLSEGQAEIRGQLTVQGAEVSALREEVRSVRADIRALSGGQAELRERLVRVETLLDPDGSSSDGDRRAGRLGVPGLGGTESRPG